MYIIPVVPSLRDAAIALGLAESTLRHQVRNGKLRAYKMGRDWYVSADEIDRYRDQHRRREVRSGPSTG